MCRYHLDICRAVAEQSYTLQTGKIHEVEYHTYPYKGGWLVMFRGTEASKFFSGGGWRDVARDLRAFPWYDERTGWAHAGFLKGARNVVEQVLLGQFHPEEPLYLAGHSLGGAMAHIAASMLCAEGFYVRDCVTFGSPRVFIGERKLAYSATNYRHPGDPVTRVPFRWGIRYRHAPQPVELPKSSVVRWNPHAVENYVDAMEKYFN